MVSFEQAEKQYYEPPDDPKYYTCDRCGKEEKQMDIVDLEPLCDECIEELDRDARDLFGGDQSLMDVTND